MSTASEAQTTVFALSREKLGHIFLVLCLFFGTSAQLLLKFAMLEVSTQSSMWLSYFWIFCGLGVYALGTAFWMLCLAYLDLSYAYPFMGLTYILVLGGAWFLFDERISLPRLVGVLVICCGVTLIPARSGRNA
jgi:drug/metabolite transporter (DMT)-like permease